MKIDIKTADEYFKTRLGSESWFELDEKQKQAAITTAYEKIKQLPFIGMKVVQSQEDIFPRYYKGYILDLPPDVVKAVFEETLHLLTIDSQGFTNIPDGLQSVSLGSASMSFSGTLNSNEISPKSEVYLSGWVKKGFDVENAKYREVY